MDNKRNAAQPHDVDPSDQLDDIDVMVRHTPPGRCVAVLLIVIVGFVVVVVVVARAAGPCFQTLQIGALLLYVGQRENTYQRSAGFLLYVWEWVGACACGVCVCVCVCV